MNDCSHDLAYYDRLNDKWLCPCCGRKWVPNDVLRMLAERDAEIHRLKRELVKMTEAYEGWGGK